MKDNSNGQKSARKTTDNGNSPFSGDISSFPAKTLKNMPDISVGTLLLLETAVSGMSLVGYVTNTAYKIKTLRTEKLTIQLPSLHTLQKRSHFNICHKTKTLNLSNVFNF